VSSTRLSLRTALPSDNPVSIPILTGLIPDGVKPGTLFLVEFDPDSQWLAVAATITASYLRAGGRVGYIASLRSPETVKETLLALGVDVSAATSEGRFYMNDWYSATLTGGRLEGGGPSISELMEGGLRMRSLKVAGLSVQWLKDMKQGFQPDDVVETWPSGALNVWESMSQTLRFNEEKPYLEWLISRANSNERRGKRIDLAGVVRDVHTESFYKRLESDFDGVIDLRVMERDDEAKNFLRIRSLKGQPHDARWHEVQIKRNSEATLLT
jgi:KaiC/GvpD/RAD55 family RecA-like ATPase